MKFLHLADLHLGKRIGEYDLNEVQNDILNKLVELSINKDIEAVVIAGDVYDTKDPSKSAVVLFNDFLTKLNVHKIQVLIIPGNHDQENRLSFGAEIFKKQGIHIVSNVKDSLTPIKIEDVNFYLLPFVDKYMVRNNFEEASQITELPEAISFVIDKMNINKEEKNVIVSHQAVLGSKEKNVKPSGSEVSLEIDKDGYIGGEDIISSKLYKDFNYVALGHIHKAMNIEDNMRYPGALLKYHKDEAGNKKSFTIVDTNDNFSIETVEIKPLRDVVHLKGKFDDVKKHNEFENDYVYFTLSDEDYLLEPMSKLKQIFKYAVSVNYDRKINESTAVEENVDVDNISKLDLFSKLYKDKKGEDLSEEQICVVKDLIKEIWG